MTDPKPLDVPLTDEELADLDEHARPRAGMEDVLARRWRAIRHLCREVRRLRAENATLRLTCAVDAEREKMAAARLQLQIDAPVAGPHAHFRDEPFLDGQTRDLLVRLAADLRRAREERTELRIDLTDALDGWDSDHEEATGFSPRIDPQSAAIRKRHGL